MIWLGIDILYIIVFAMVILAVIIHSVSTFRKNIKEGEFCHYNQRYQQKLGIILRIDSEYITVENIITKETTIVNKSDLYPPQW